MNWFLWILQAQQAWRDLTPAQRRALSGGHAPPRTIDRGHRPPHHHHPLPPHRGAHLMIDYATFERIALLDISGEIARQVTKHGENSCPNLSASDPRWLPILVEEVGEVATEVAHLDPEHEPVDLRKELVQVAAVAIAWIAAIDREGGTFHPRGGDL